MDVLPLQLTNRLCNSHHFFSIPIVLLLQSNWFVEHFEKFNQREAFVTIKDHWKNFQINPTCRLLNLAKSEIGIISKHYMEKE